MDFILSKATITGRPVFTCHNCGCKAAGDRITIECESETDMLAALHRAPRAHQMPVGWSSHYAPQRDYFTCPDCEEN